MPGPVIIAGVNPQTGNMVQCQADGNTLSLSQNGTRATYRYVAANFTPAATATDVLVLRGSATKVVRVTRVSISGAATAASMYDYYIYKRTTVNSGGVISGITGANADSNDGAATGSLVIYSTNPTTLGTGTPIAANKAYLPASASPSSEGSPIVYTFGDRGDKAIVLRGSAQSLAINFNGQAVPAGASMFIAIEWTEDSA